MKNFFPNGNLTGRLNEGERVGAPASRRQVSGLRIRPHLPFIQMVGTMFSARRVRSPIPDCMVLD